MKDPRPTTGFDRKRRGYDPSQVDDRLAELDATITDLHRDRARAAAAADAQEAELALLRRRTALLQDQIEVARVLLARARTSARPGAHVVAARIIAALALARDTTVATTGEPWAEADIPPDETWREELDHRRITEIRELANAVAAGRATVADVRQQARDEARALRDAAAQEAAAVRAAAERHARELDGHAEAIRAQIQDALGSVRSMSAVLEPAE